MATGKSGTINGTVYKSNGAASGAWKVRVEWSETYDVSGNTSSVTGKLHYSLDYPSGVTPSKSSGTVKGKLTINGSSKDYSYSFSNKTDGDDMLVCTYTVNSIAHASDGSKTISISATGGAGTSLSSTSLSDSVVLTKIPRQSSISNVSPQSGSSYIYFGENPIVKWTPNVSSYKYKLTYKLGGHTVYAENIAPGSTSTYTYNSLKIPLNSTWVGAIGSSATSSKSLYVTLDTYNGSSLIGSSTSGPYTIALPSSVKPTANALTLTGDNLFNGKYLQNRSTVTVSASGSGIYTSTVKKIELFKDGKSVTTSSTSPLKYTSGVFASPGTVSFSSTVTDTRSRSKSSSDVSVTVIPYYAPQILYTNTQRCTNDGTLADDGTCAKISVRYRYWRVSGSNSMSDIRVRYKDRTLSSWSGWLSGFTTTRTETSTDYITIEAYKIFGNGGINIDCTYDVQFNISDAVGSDATSSDIISTEYVLLDFNRSGKGIAVGKVSDTDALEISPGMNIKAGVQPAAPLADWVIEIGGRGPGWRYQKWASGFAELWYYGDFITTGNTQWSSTDLYYTDLIYIPMPFQISYGVVTGTVNGGCAYVANAASSWADQSIMFRLARTGGIAEGSSFGVRLHVVGEWGENGHNRDPISPIA